MNQPWFDTNREVLGKVIPLDTPLAITITPSSICNFKCHYCLHSNRELMKEKGFKVELMKWDIFTDILRQIKEFPKNVKKIEFYGMGEPLLNSQLPAMISCVKQYTDFQTTIMTNGYALTHELSESLIAAGTDEIKISIQGLDDETYLKTCGVKVDFQKLLNEIKYLNSIKNHCKIYVKIIAPASDYRFKFIFGFVDRYAEENILPLFNDINQDNGKSRYGNSRRRHICTMPFYRLIVLTDGRVTPCCDPLNAVYYGNIKETTLVEMWNSPKRKSLLISLLNGNSYKLCQNCYMPNDVFTEEDDLEPYRNEILRRINNEIMS